MDDNIKLFIHNLLTFNQNSTTIVIRCKKRLNLNFKGNKNEISI